MYSAPTQLAGVIAECEHADCGHSCCEFAEGNFIVLYPGEVDAARQTGRSLEHLRLSPMPHGGFRATCNARDKSSCDDGYKPLDCASYPFFPTIDGDGRIAADLKGEKCPLQTVMLAAHRRWVIAAWTKLSSTVPGIAKWIARTRLVGYSSLAPTELSKQNAE